MSNATTTAWTMWVRWERATAGARIGTIERLPRVVGAIFVERGDATEIDPATLTPDVRRRGGTA